MKLIFSGQVPKDPMFPEANEDIIALATEVGRIAVSDGASESFDSKTWAFLLTNQFLLNPDLNLDWLADAVADYFVRFDLTQMSWSKQAAFERGSFSTLLGVNHCVSHDNVEVFGIGDSIAVLLDGEDYVDSFPYERAEEFQQRPDLFCTNAIFNSIFSSPDFFPRHHKAWSLTGKMTPIILCMTDALGEWAFRKAEEGNPVWKILAGIEDASALEALVQRERQARNMRIDDTTLVTLSF